MVCQVTNVDLLVKCLDERLDDYFMLADIGVNEVGLLSVNGKLEDVLALQTGRKYQLNDARWCL